MVLDCLNRKVTRVFYDKIFRLNTKENYTNIRKKMNYVVDVAGRAAPSQTAF